MEYVELLKDMWSSISNYFNYHKILNENLTTLREKRKRLECREEDINIELEDAQCNRRKKAKREVKNWLKEVQHVKDSAQKIEQEAGERRYFSRLSFLSQFEANMNKVDKMFKLGKFPTGIFIDVHQDEGNALLTTQLIGETTAQRNLENIWTCLEKGFQSIGVWGMGGIGKTTVVTHIHNRLLENRDTFGHVYWVTVSKDSSIRKLQDAIAGKINLDFSKEEDEKIRAAFLFGALQEKDKFVLILDDVWEVYVPREVGIPIGVDGGKLIITTRSRDVCLKMGCKETIEVEPLSEEEAWELFNKTLEPNNTLRKTEEELKVSSATTEDQFPFIHLFRFPLHSLPMAKPSIIPISLFLAAMAAVLIPIPAEGLMPYTRNLWDMVLPFDDPFRILEHSPITVPKGLETIALARSDWKETTSAHIITLDVPGMKKEDIKIEIEENRVLRISGGRTAEEEVEGEKWHRSERATGKFWRQFRLPANADLDRIKAHLENGVLKITIPKLAEDRKKQAKVVNIAEETNSGEDVMATKSEM